jgi:hypothetical protein
VSAHPHCPWSGETALTDVRETKEVTDKLDTPHIPIGSGEKNKEEQIKKFKLYTNKKIIQSTTTQKIKIYNPKNYFQNYSQFYIFTQVTIFFKTF